jgi:hypothetical protein
MDLLIEKTINTPQVIFHSTSNEWIISGKSYPKEALAFYEPVLKWVDMCKSTEIENCNFQFRLEFFNTSSSKVLLDILIKLKEIMDKGKTRLSVKWFYENDDEDIKESGEMLMELARMPIEFVGY